MPHQSEFERRMEVVDDLVRRLETTADADARAAAQAEPRESPADVSDVEARDGGLDAAAMSALPGAFGAFGGQRGDEQSQAKRGPVPSPIDRLFDDPFEWSGS